MEHFCFNPECMMHRYQGNEKIHEIEIEEKGLCRKIQRYVYSNRQGKIIFVCSICHAAIRLITIP